MLLFLMRDTARKHPVGFEKVRRNIFDPEEDKIVFGTEAVPESPVPDLPPAMTNKDDSNVFGGESHPETNLAKIPETKVEAQVTNNDTANCEETKHVEDDEKKKEEKMKKGKQKQKQCLREGCQNRPRFDSSFCSDACGVSALEHDLFLTIRDSSEIHPAVLRN